MPTVLIYAFQNLAFAFLGEKTITQNESQEQYLQKNY